MHPIQRELRKLKNPVQARVYAGFFKTGEGEYGEGDRFLGIKVPMIRAIAKTHANTSLDELHELIQSPWHEERFAALVILVERFRQAQTQEERMRLGEWYVAHTRWMNNWDLVDVAAYHIVGPLAVTSSAWRKKREALSQSSDLWERRIAIVSTLHDIKQGDARAIFAFTKRRMNDTEDLIHKACGWMLREVGKHVGEAELKAFLREHEPSMPRTMFRYAIERLQPNKKRDTL